MPNTRSTITNEDTEANLSTDYMDYTDFGESGLADLFRPFGLGRVLTRGLSDLLSHFFRQRVPVTFGAIQRVPVGGCRIVDGCI